MSKDEVRETLDVRSETKTPWIEVRPEIIYNREHRGPRRRSFRCINQEGNPCFSHSNPLDSPVSCSLPPVALFFGLSVSGLTSHVLRILALPVSCSLTPAALFFRLFVSRLTSHVFSLNFELDNFERGFPVSCSLTPAALFFGLSVSRLTSHVLRILALPDSCLLPPRSLPSRPGGRRPEVPRAAVSCGERVSRLTSHVSRSLPLGSLPCA